MNTKLKIAVAVVAIVVVGTTAVVGSGALSSSPVPPPANVEVLQVGPNSITLGWGPTLPGELKAGKATVRWLTITWAPSSDNHGAVTYNVSKNGQLIASGLSTPTAKIPLVKGEVQFRACVWAASTQGKPGPQMCATFNGR